MKKFFLFVMAAGMMLCGCGTDDVPGQLEKAQEIRIYKDGSDECVQILDEASDMEKFVRQLNLEDWTEAPLPEQAEASGSFVLRQEETLKQGQRAEDREMEETCRIYFYRTESFVRLEFAGLDLTFEVPEETAEALNTYF